MSPLDQAIALVKSGRTADAERLLRDHIASTADGSTDRMRAWYDLGGILQYLGDLPRAADCMLMASSMLGRADDRDHEQLRLTIAWNLGSLLVQLGRLDDALELARGSLDERAKFYGKDHPGYGYGLEGLAEVQLARGELTDALATIEEALGLFARTGNARFAEAFVLRAPIAKACGHSAFAPVAELPDEMFDPIVGGVLGDERAPAEVRVAVLEELLEALSARPQLAPWLPQVYAQLSNVAAEAGAHGPRRAALARLLEHFDARSDAQQALGVVLAIALAEDHAGDAAAALARYRDADARAARFDASSRARVNRNFGLFLAEHDGKPEADQRLAAAVDLAREAGQSDELGRCVIARGIFLQHAQRPAEAQPLLEEGIRVLPPEHGDAICARDHLSALREGGKCGCGDTARGIGDALLEMVRASVPGDLVDGIRVELRGDEPPGISVQLAREPTPDERVALDSAVSLAIATVRGGLRNRGRMPVG